MEQNTATLVHDDDMERALLGSLILNPGELASVSDVLTPDCFYNPECLEVYNALYALDSAGDKPDMATLGFELRKRQAKADVMLVVNLTNEAGAFDQIRRNALRLRELSARRKLWEIGTMLSQAGTSEAVDFDSSYEGAVRSLEDVMTMPTANIRTLADANADLMWQVDRNRNGGNGITGTPTGFAILDENGGLQASDLIIIAGETSQGKTSFAQALVSGAVKAGRKVAFYSMEMTGLQLAARFAAMSSGIPSNSILYKRLEQPEYTRLARTMIAAEEPGKNLFFDDTSTSSIETIMNSIRSMKFRHNIDGAVVDYLQILNVNTKTASPEQQMGMAARELKNLAKRLGIWIVALSQLSRDKDNPAPSLNRLRASGQIAEAADTVMLVYRPSYYGRKYPEPFTDQPTENTAMIDVAKGRNIGVFKFLVDFNPATTLFSERQTKITFNAPVRDSDMPF